MGDSTLSPRKSIVRPSLKRDIVSHSVACPRPEGQLWIHLRRRELISLMGGAAWPLAARAQQPAPPLIGFLSSLASSDLNLVVPAVREGLNGAGFVEGRNITVEYR